MLLSGLKSSIRHIPKATLSITAMSAVRAASHAAPMQNIRPEPDKVIQDISDYVHTPEKVQSALARETARLCLIDTLGCGLEALRFKPCAKLLGPLGQRALC
jgi:2-methylcitrate dehydratase